MEFSRYENANPPRKLVIRDDGLGVSILSGE